MTRVFSGERTLLSPVLRPVEAGLYWLGGVDERREQHWLTYTVSMLFFHVGGFLIIYALMRLQAGLPFNPAEQSAVTPDLSFDTAISFITNTNWQNYGGESTLSYLVQMLGLAHQNFLSATTGLVLSAPPTLRFPRAATGPVGNFWVHTTGSTPPIRLPTPILYPPFLHGPGTPHPPDLLSLGESVDDKVRRLRSRALALLPLSTAGRSRGPTNPTHDSLRARGGLIPLIHSHLGRVILGGVGPARCGMLLFVILAIFV